MGRLTQSEFILNLLERKQEEDANNVVLSSSKKVTDLPSTSLELLFSAFSNTAAIQVFAQTANEFKIGIFDLQKQSLLYWLPNPTIKNGRSIGIEKRKALRLSWSPSGSDLAISYPESTFIWNATDKKWRTAGTTDDSWIMISQEGLLWIDDDQVLTYNFSNDGPRSTNDVFLQRVSMPNQNPTSIGMMKNLSIRQVFLLKSTPKQEAPR